MARLKYDARQCDPCLNLQAENPSDLGRNPINSDEPQRPIKRWHTFLKNVLEIIFNLLPRSDQNNLALASQSGRSPRYYKEGIKLDCAELHRALRSHQTGDSFTGLRYASLKRVTLTGTPREIKFNQIKPRPEIESIDLPQCKDVTDLNADWCFKISDKALENLPPDLTTIILSRCRLITNQGLKNLPPNLKSLTIDERTLLSDEALKHFREKLETLSMKECPSISNNGLKLLFNRLKNLSTLVINGENITDDGPTQIPRNLVNLRLIRCKNITDKKIEDLPQNLKKLDLSCAQISIAGLKKLPGTLTELNISYCINIDKNSLSEFQKHRGTLSITKEF
jgi:hypothetical protein